MRTLLLALTLALLPGCALMAAPADTIPTNGAIGRLIDRLATRHDDYVLADVSIDPAASDAALEQSADLRAVCALPEVARGSFRAVLAPVADRYDAYVRADPVLEPLDRETFLATSHGLRRLAGAGE